MKRDAEQVLKTAATIGLALSAGAAAMYLLDPDRGRTRRTRIRDKAYRYMRESEHLVEKAGRDLRNRTAGAIHEAKSMLSREDVADVKLIERVRSKLGRVASHPHAVVVSAEHGRITLEGPILQHELEQTLRSIRKVDGVKHIESRLQPYTNAESHPALEGGRPLRGQRMAMFRTRWAPSVKLGACLVGAGCLIFGIVSRGKVAKAAAGTGLLLFARGATNREVSRLKELIRS
jgi:hypothetical protein